MNKLWILALILMPGLLFADSVVILKNAKIHVGASGKSKTFKIAHKGDVFDLSEPPKKGRYYVVKIGDQEGFIYETMADIKTTAEVDSDNDGAEDADTDPSVDSTEGEASGVTTVVPGTLFAVPEPFDGCSKSGDADSGTQSDVDLNKLKNRDYTDLSMHYEKLSISEVFAIPTPTVKRAQKMATWSAIDLKMARTQEKRAVEIQGYLLAAKQEGPESCNCHNADPKDRDFHVWLGEKPGDGTATPDRTNAMVVEISPRIRSVHPEWVLKTLSQFAREGTPVKIKGLLMYDDEHPEQLGKTRGTLWEIHPILMIEYQKNGTWMELE